MKRPRDGYDTPHASTSEPPSKRTRARSDAGHASSSLAPTSSPFTSASTRSTPYTPYSFLRTPFSIPSDSPSNPFGIKRSLVALTLPRAIGFAKHLALRFQLVLGDDADVDTVDPDSKKRKKRDSDDKDRATACRIVQVPTNYTIRHLHKLVLFLFASDVPLRELSRGSGNGTAHRRSARVAEKRTTKAAPPKPAPAPVDAKGKGKNTATTSRMRAGGAGPSTVRPRPTDPGADTQIPDGWTHFFDVRTGISLYNGAYKPGVIKPGSGRTYTRLSSVRERRLFPHLYEEVHGAGTSADADEDVTGCAGSSGRAEGDDEDEEEQQGWIWEAEDDFTVAHVWPNGPELDRAIIYHHLPGVAVHITINTMRLPPRKGVGNKPYVFRARRSARGCIRIAHLDAIRLATLPVRAAPHVPPDDDALDPSAEWDEAQQIRRWNSTHAFARLLEREGAREGALCRAASPSPPLSPTRALSPLPRASPASSPTSLRELALGSSPASVSDAADADLPDPLVALPSTTPYPAHPAARRRIARAGRALARLTASGLDDMSSDEEEVDELTEEEGLAGDPPPEEDDPPIEDDPPVEEEIDKSDWEQWEWDWDPFGEAEI
ncbi:hypothetical protein B0H21DRAFT_748796 [Amylocystis lapponica]|nr:hypothetical protein B0H21DRAFT_748796 [Amylocystis lapponica]